MCNLFSMHRLTPTFFHVSLVFCILSAYTPGYHTRARTHTSRPPPLRVHCSIAPQVADLGILSLSRGAPSLTSLDISACVAVTDAGIAHLASGVAGTGGGAGLQELRLDGLPLLSDDGIDGFCPVLSASGVQSCPVLSCKSCTVLPVQNGIFGNFFVFGDFLSFFRVPPLIT